MIDLTGQTFERLTVIGRGKRSRSGEQLWICKCSCGNSKEIRKTSLTNGDTRSCGCIRRETRRTHGGKKTRLYSIWRSMKKRCTEPNCQAFPHYGGRGITICEEWISDFAEFRKWAHENGYENSLTIDRINNNGNYCPENCRWATRKEQQNNKRNTLYRTFQGTTKTVVDWMEELGISRYDAKNLGREGS